MDLEQTIKFLIVLHLVVNMKSSGNFCTLNPLAQPNAGTYSEGNLLFTHTASAWRTSFGTHGITSGKWYWEAYQYEDIGTGNGFPLGIFWFKTK